jgi:thiamine biosynthesis lipoprotein ApbE
VAERHQRGARLEDLGPEDGRGLIESEPNTEALLIDPDGRVHMTSGFRGLTQ